MNRPHQCDDDCRSNGCPAQARLDGEREALQEACTYCGAEAGEDCMPDCLGAPVEAVLVDHRPRPRAWDRDQTDAAKASQAAKEWRATEARLTRLVVCVVLVVVALLVLVASGLAMPARATDGCSDTDPTQLEPVQRGVTFAAVAP